MANWLAIRSKINYCYYSPNLLLWKKEGRRCRMLREFLSYFFSKDREGGWIMTECWLALFLNWLPTGLLLWIDSQLDSFSKRTANLPLPLNVLLSVYLLDHIPICLGTNKFAWQLKYLLDKGPHCLTSDIWSGIIRIDITI